MILLIDNYDSFVFNLQRYLARLGQSTMVVRNDQIDFDRMTDGQFAAVVISPGPKAPKQAGRCIEVVERFADRLPVLGVCLGHQVICQALGARIIRAPRAVHGQASPVEHNHSRLFNGLPSPFLAARYHSLVADPHSMPTELRVTGTTEAGSGHPPIIMAVEHVRLPIFGVQFHPESILSSVGYRILANFLMLAGLSVEKELPETDFASSDVWERFCDQSRSCGPALEQSNSNPIQQPLAVLPQSSHYAPDSNGQDGGRGMARE